MVKESFLLERKLMYTQNRNINYEENINCFKLTENVTSHLFHDFKPWITVFIPTYCRTDLFKEALLSVINQKPVSFPWEIIVVDNEPWNNIMNENEKFIIELNNGRIRYFRNSKNLRPGDNFNRGISLARGEWVMMLHDDDLLLPNTLEKMGRAIRFLQQQKGKPLGAIAAQYHCFSFSSEKPHEKDKELKKISNYYMHEPMSFRFFKLTHANVLFTAHPGGNIPSVGTTFNKEAVLKTGGFNDDLGICADLILFYALENNYSVYSTLEPYGFYRWGANTMIKYESAYQTIKFCYDFREYVYNKSIFHKLWGIMFRTVHYYLFINQVLDQRKLSTSEKITFEDYVDIYNKKPNEFFYKIYKHNILSLYNRIKFFQVNRLEKKAKHMGVC